MNHKILVFVVLLALVAAACAMPAQSGRSLKAPAGEQASEIEQPQVDTTESEPDAEPSEPDPTQTAEPEAPAESTEGGSERAPTPTPLVPLNEILSGGPPPDGIPPIDAPKFVTVEAAGEWLVDREPVVAVELKGAAKAYPLQIMTWHEIVNDEFGDRYVSVTYCPLCNTALVFDREVNGTIYDFGTSGRLYNSALVMYDRQTESWWSQVMGKAIVGELTGTQLAFVPSAIVSWGDFKATHPDGKVLSRETGHRRPYGANPYAQYDSPGNRPFLFRGEIDERLDAMERVVGVEFDDEAKAYAFSMLAEERVVADTVGGREVVVFYYPGTASALDQERIAESRDIGAAAVFDPVLDGRQLTFGVDEEDGVGGTPSIVDDETGSTWNVLGEATSGPLAGEALTPIVHGNHFWFAWAAFNPETAIFEAG
ncbi:MAG: hypothetical protein MAG451_01384 [Anaerolineales bacterium]|nr:hypothetical protein [Anaerolineales bacterium]